MRTKRYTRTLTIVIAVLLVAVACHDNDGRHWPRSSGTSTVIYVDTSRVDNAVRGTLAYGADVWSRSSRLDIRVRNSCPTGANCVTARQANRSNAVTNTWFIGDHFTRATVTFPADWGRRADLRRAAFAGCHEVGHVVGFGHADGTSWPCDRSTLRPTQHEFESIADIYRHTDSSGPPGV